MILYDKSEEELNAEALAFLAETDIKNDSPGSRAKTILEIVNKVLRSYYVVLDFNVTMGVVSKAAGDFLDGIGALLNCERILGEDDDNYRYRITNQVYTAQCANETAVRLAALSVDHVVDVVLNPWTFGTGSYSVHVIADYFENLTEAIAGVQDALNQVQAYGVKGVAVAPKVIPIGMTINLAFLGTTSQDIKTSTAFDIQSAVKDYINKLNMGDSLVLSSIIQIIRDTAKDSIRDASISVLKANNKPVLIENYDPYWDEKLYVAADQDINVA